VPVSHLVK